MSAGSRTVTAMRLITAAALAAEWEMTEAELARLRRRYGWPCVRLSRTDIRFTEEQIAQIVAMHSEAAQPPEKPLASGQTRRSAQRNRP